MLSLPSLKILDINIGMEEVAALSEDLNHKSLQVVKVTSADNALYSTLELPYNLAQIFLTNCMCLPTKPWPLPFYFYCNYPDLNMSFCEMSITEVKVLSEDLKINHLCTRLALINCGLDDVAASLLSRGLNHCSDLERLELSFNSISDSGVIEISSNIQSCGKLCKLDLSFNKIGNEGAIIIISKRFAKHQ